MKKKFHEIIEKHHTFDSLLGYVFSAFLVITFLTAFPKLPHFLYDFGQILQTILGALIIIGIIFAFVCGIVEIITDKKVKSD